MSVLLILLGAILLLALGYVLYGGWLARQWGVDPERETPAHTEFDGKDYVPANPGILMGHHFASIAGADGLIGTIQAAAFGWVPVLLWLVIGGIFAGAVHDFGALFASLRHKGRSIGAVIKDSMGQKAQRLFTALALLTLILLIASFTIVVAGTFANTADSLITTGIGRVSASASTATTSLLFILLAWLYGFLVYRKNAPMGFVTVLALIGVVGVVVAGLALGVNLSYPVWVGVIAVYVTVASLLPVWKLLQPRDYLSSFLLYAMMLLALVGIVVSAVTGKANMELPAFTGWQTDGQSLFPFLFVLAAGGALSGYHSLVASGTTAKQLSNEKHARTIGYGGMLLQTLLGVIALVAVGVIASRGASISSPEALFAAGLATLISPLFGGDGSLVSQGLVYNLLSLTVSMFALTTLDTACRLSRYLFQELLVPEGVRRAKLSGARKFFSHPLVATLLVVLLGCGLGLSPVLGQLRMIWSLFGAASLLLAFIAMLAVSVWMGQNGKNNKMFYLPMALALVVSVAALGSGLYRNVLGILSGGDWTLWCAALWALALLVLALILTAAAIRALARKDKAESED